MADDTITTIAETSEVELEAKRQTDGSWHPCQVSLCSGGGLSVKFEDQVLEDIILDVKDAFAVLRVRSIPLQGDDCCSIGEGKSVLAACEDNSQKLFFDAIVQTAIRVRHSKRALCRCTFMIKWPFEDAERGTLSIPSTSIMKLATESINAHPVVAAFLNPIERSYLSTPSASSTVFDDTENEIDLHGLLKQIEGIGSLADASQKELKDTFFEVNHGERDGQNKLFSLQQVSKCVQVSICGKSPLRRSARRQNISEPTIESSTPPSVEKCVQNQSPLSPLASRAVLASLVSKRPQKDEFVLHEERKCAFTSDFPSSVQFSEGFGTHIVNKMESLVTNERVLSGKKFHAQKSNGLMMEVCNKIEPSLDSGGSLSMRDEESTLPVVTSRLTRSAKKRGSSITNLDDDSTSIENAVCVRVTRSAAQKQKENLAGKSIEKLVQEKVRSTRSTCSAPKEEIEAPDVESKTRNTDEVTNCTTLRSTTRLTRSTARTKTGILDDRATEPLQAKSDTESAQPQNYNSDYEAMPSTKKRTFLCIDSELKSAESDKKLKDLNAVDRRQKKTVEDVYGNLETLPQKKSSSKNQSSRFAPRSRSSPRTRSQDQS